MTCQQSVGLLARLLEEAGISTVCVLSRPDLAEITKPPRTLIARFPYGAPLGEANNVEQQVAVIQEALTLLEVATIPGQLVESEQRWKR